MQSRPWPADRPPPRRIVVLTGAGISKESGLSTFRDKDGLWARVRVEDVATAEAFARDPDAVQAFYNMRRQVHQDPALQPNDAHRALARLEREFPGELLLVTQNIDNLHERAGSSAPVHMHGEMLKARCLDCGSVCRWTTDLDAASRCAACDATGRLRPHVVWFGEMPLQMPAINAALKACDLFVSIGTSGNVYPAAGFVERARVAGAHTVELNLEPSHGIRLFRDAFHGPATEVVPAFVDSLLAACIRA